MEPHEAVNKKRRGQIFLDNFLGGIAWALGATVGLAVIVALLGFILQNINLVPFVGGFIADVINFVIAKNPQLIPN
jgi:hypothetical protein